MSSRNGAMFVGMPFWGSRLRHFVLCGVAAFSKAATHQFATLLSAAFAFCISRDQAQLLPGLHMAKCFASDEPRGDRPGPSYCATCLPFAVAAAMGTGGTVTNLGGSTRAVRRNRCGIMGKPTVPLWRLTLRCSLARGLPQAPKCHGYLISSLTTTPCDGESPQRIQYRLWLYNVRKKVESQGHHEQHGRYAVWGAGVVHQGPILTCRGCGQSLPLRLSGTGERGRNWACAGCGERYEGFLNNTHRLELIQHVRPDRLSFAHHGIQQPPSALAEFIARIHPEVLRGPDQRACPRFSVVTSVAVMPLSDSLEPMGPPFLVLTRNISRSGMAMVSTRAVATDAMLGVELPRCPEEASQVVVHVLRCQPMRSFYEIAGQFLTKMVSPEG